MKGLMFQANVWQGKRRILEQSGEAQTRRLVGLEEINKEPDIYLPLQMPDGVWFFEKPDGDGVLPKPGYHVNEVVYVKEAWRVGDYSYPKCANIMYRSDGFQKTVPWDEWLERNTKYGGSCCGDEKWRSPMFLKSAYARYFIQITAIIWQRLQDITEADAIKEGVELGSARGHFSILWDNLNPKFAWDSNPFVFVYTFHRVDKSVDMLR